MLHKPSSQTPLKHTAIEDIPKIHARLKTGFGTRKSRPVEWRKQQIAQLAYMLIDNAEKFEQAAMADLGRHQNDTHLYELGATHNAIRHVLNNIDSWAKTKRAAFDIRWFAFSPKIRHEPRGVLLLIGPFNYPLYTNLPAFATAIAAGNAVLFKPSEATPATSTLFAELFPKYLDPDMFAVVNGAIAETACLLDLRWDHIFFTGSPKVGRVVAMAAAKHLTPVTLELGGKSPVVIDCDPETSNFPLAAKRLLWGKTVNVGQTCIAPDYVLIEKHRQEEFVNELQKAHERFWPSAQGGPRDSEFYGRVVNEAHLDRITNLLEKTEGTVVIGGEWERAERFLAPTVVKDCTGDDSLMSEEIFGPVLPIVPVDTIEDAIEFINARESPLCVTVFSKSESVRQHVFNNTQSGAAIGNETILHAGCIVIPFGGVGMSGYGRHAGYFGFETFSHKRGEFQSPGWIDHKYLFGVRYPPLKKSDLKIIALLWAEGSVPYERLGEGRTSFPWGSFFGGLTASVILAAGYTWYNHV